VSWDECHRFTRMHWSEEINALLAAHDQKVREQATLDEHKSHVEFESELYATLVDPVAEGSIKEAEMRKQLLEQARWYRQRVYDLENEPNVRYAAYANHCAIQGKVPLSFHSWRKL